LFAAERDRACSIVKLRRLICFDMILHPDWRDHAVVDAAIDSEEILGEKSDLTMTHVCPMRVIQNSSVTTSRLIGKWLPPDLIEQVARLATICAGDADASVPP